MVETKIIILDQQEIVYKIHYKRIKNCYLRVEKGEVVIRCSPLFSQSEIEKLIRNHQEEILEQIKGYVPKYNYQEDGYVYLFNQKYQIVLKDMNIKKCAIQDRQIYVYSKNIQATIEMFLKQELMNYLKDSQKDIYNFSKRIDFYLSTSFHHVFPEIQIKKMKRRWGACFYQKNRVCFNLVLAHIDYALIDYVIVHELCHFLEANHSKAFYHEIEKRMPDYKERERLLKDVGI